MLGLSWSTIIKSVVAVIGVIAVIGVLGIAFGFWDFPAWLTKVFGDSSAYIGLINSTIAG